MLEHVRKPNEDDIKDEKWRPLFREKRMIVSVILGHPYEYSFNHAIAETVVNRLQKLGHTVFFHDLYEEKFDAILMGHELVSGKTSNLLVQQHMDEIREADGIVIIHPNWWGMPPAILKGWVDRVLRQGVAYAFNENDDGSGIPLGLLKAEIAIVLNTANTPEERENTVFGDPLETIWKNCIFDFCGVKNFHRHVFRVIAGSKEHEREGWLEEAGEITNRYFG